LIAKGTASQPVVFTSARENPAPGDWYGIQFLQTSLNISVMEHCVVEYGGVANYPNIRINDSSPAIRNTIVRRSSAHGIQVSSGNPVISHVTVQDTRMDGIHVNGGDPAISYVLVQSTGDGYADLRIPITNFANMGSENQFPDGKPIVLTGGTLNKDATLFNYGVPYQMGGLNVQGTNGMATLTIEPGVRVQFNQNGWLQVSSSATNPGALVAKGTASQPIVFTSARENPAPGDWYGIQFLQTSLNTSVMEHCVVEHGGVANYPNIRINDSSPAIKSSVIRHGKTLGIQVNSGNPAISDTIVHNSGNADLQIPITSFDNMGTGNQFPDGKPIVLTGSTLNKDATLFSYGVPYQMGGLYVHGTGGANGMATLTIEPGVRVQFGQGGWLQISSSVNNPGALIAKGTASQPIVFTSARETPAPGDWYGIQFFQTSINTSLMEHCVIEYGGVGSYPNIRIDNSSPVIRNSVIRHGKTHGIQVNSGNPIIEFNNIVNNLQFGVFKQSAPAIDAKNNWWGHSSGPLDTVNNPTGQGDKVSGNVNYIPWALTPFN